MGKEKQALEEREMLKQTDRQTDQQTDRPTDRQTERTNENERTMD